MTKLNYVVIIKVIQPKIISQGTETLLRKDFTAMNYRIVADSSADLAIKAINIPTLVSVPLKIITAEAEYVDDASLDTGKMVSALESYKGRSSSSCPNVSDWIEAFGDADIVFCITITSGLSGSYNSASAAKEEYESEHPERKVFVIDSLSTGPEMALIEEKLCRLIEDGLPFEEICASIKAYQKKTGLLFMLESMKNLANNGRVSPIVAKLAGMLGIRVIGKASDVGTLEQLEKSRGETKALPAIIEQMKALGFDGGRVKIAHCMNPEGAEKLKALLESAYPSVEIDVYPCRGLCSFYAERGGLLVGFEKALAN